MPLATAPNAAIPAGLRRRAFDSAVAGAKDHAAGVLFVAPDGDVLMLRRASGEQNYGGHWALPGGKGDAGETPEQTAEREAGEELGRKPDGAGKVLDRRVTPTGMAFHTFAYPVSEKFQPKLNFEHSGYAWTPIDQLPRPLHPGVEATMKDRLGTADDMSPEDWKGLRDGFLRWTLEEEREPDHAADEALAFDAESVREVDKNGRLHVAVSNISKATVNPYRGKEVPNHQKLGLEPDRIYNFLRDPAELEKAAPSFNGIQVLQRHVGVKATDPQQWEVVGSTGTDAQFEDPYLRNSLSIWVQSAIDSIDSNEKRELSSSYSWRAEMTPGIFDGMPYDGVMRDIVANHVALVKDGRAGPDVLVGDSMENLKMKPTRFAARGLRLTARSILPVLAMDAKLPDLMPMFADVTPANFKTKRPGIDAAIKRDVKLANDASLEGVMDMLDALEGSKVDGDDESVSEEQHKAMEAAASGESNLGIPKAVGQEFVAQDAGVEKLKGFLKEKGMGDADIKAACDMLPKAMAGDESPEEKEKREKDEKAEKDKAASDKAARDAEMKEMVTKPAMDAALKLHGETVARSVRENERGIRSAIAEVRPWTGELSPSLAFDSALDVYQHAAGALGVADAKKIADPAALLTIIKLHQRPGARPVEKNTVLAMDSAEAKGFAGRFADAGRIRVV